MATQHLCLPPKVVTICHHRVAELKYGDLVSSPQLVRSTDRRKDKSHVGKVMFLDLADLTRIGPRARQTILDRIRSQVGLNRRFAV